MDLSIAIVSWNTSDLLDQCLKSVYEMTDGIEFEVIVVDNASSDGSADMVRGRYPRVKLIENTGNVGFARANNQAYAVSSGRHFLLLNPDTICLPNALPMLVDFLDQRPKAGVVGPLILNPDKTLQYSWARFPTLWSESVGRLDRRIRGASQVPATADEARALDPFQADWIGGCTLMIRREAVEQVGLMDDDLFMYSEETDWCYRLNKAGWEVCVNPVAEIIHIGGQSSNQVSSTAYEYLLTSKVRYFRKHHGRASAVTITAVLRAKRLMRGILSGKDSGGTA